MDTFDIFLFFLFFSLQIHVSAYLPIFFILGVILLLLLLFTLPVFYIYFDSYLIDSSNRKLLFYYVYNIYGCLLNIIDILGKVLHYFQLYFRVFQGTERGEEERENRRD